MKKLIFFGLIFVASFSLFSQTADKIETEYYGLKWGCSPAELKAKYPSAYPKGKNKDGDDIYYFDTNDATRIFFFGNNKLYGGRIVYEGCTVDKVIALINKIANTYGKFDSGPKKSSDGLTATKRYSSKITITINVNMEDSSFVITYINEVLASQIIKDRVEKMQDDLEI